MIDYIKNTFGNAGEGDPRADGGVSVTEEDNRDVTDGQYRLETNDRGDVRPDSTQERPTEPTIEIDQVFEILKNQRRRYVLEYLTMVDEQVRLGELAEQIAAWEYDKDVRAITSQERKRVYVGLYQCHLPKMDDVGAVSYNKPRGKIETGPNIDIFEQYLPIEKCATEQPRTIRTAVAVVSRFFERK